MKIAKDETQAFEMQEMHENKPHGWIHWGGTTVCMDIQCACGRRSHIDADYAYCVKCPDCGKVYFCNGHIEFIEVLKEPEDCVVMGG